MYVAEGERNAFMRVAELGGILHSQSRGVLNATATVLFVSGRLHDQSLCVGTRGIASADPRFKVLEETVGLSS